MGYMGLYRGSIGILEKKMETTRMGDIGIISGIPYNGESNGTDNGT